MLKVKFLSIKFGGILTNATILLVIETEILNGVF